MPIIHFVWDFDGTLFDSYPAMARSFQIVLAEHGFYETIEDIMGYLRVSYTTAWQHYKEVAHLDEEVLDAIKKTQLRTERHLQPYPYTKEVLTRLKELGGSHYGLTHRNHSAIDHLTKAGMLDLFTEVITSESGFPRKPDPTGLQSLIQKYDPNPSHWLMIGDRNLDLETGMNAHVATCALRTGAVIDEQLATFTISEVKELLPLIEKG